MNISNTDRIIPSGLSVIGWFAKTSEDGIVSVHVDVGFDVGKFGGRPTDQVEFELNLRRAEVVVVCGGGAEPKFSTIAKVKKPSVAIAETTKHKTTMAAEGQLELGFDAGLKGKAGGKVAGQKSVEHITTSEVEGIATDFLIRHLRTTDGDPAWEVRGEKNKPLQGNPWDANEHPRIQVKMPAEGSLAEPTIRVEVRCRGEDLDFGDGIKLKDKSKRDLFSRISNNAKNLAAAEQYLKKVLEEEGLVLETPGEKYGSLVLADVVLTLE